MLSGAYLDVVDRCGAKSFVMENVYELYRSEELAQIAQRARHIGFAMRAEISMLRISVSPKPAGVRS